MTIMIRCRYPLPYRPREGDSPDLKMHRRRHMRDLRMALALDAALIFIALASFLYASA